MQIYVDDKMVEVDGGTLDEILDIAQSMSENEDRIVVEVIVDGEGLDQDALEALLDQKMTASEIRLMTADPKELAVTALGDTQGMLRETQRVQGEIATLLQTDDASRAFASMQEVLGAWSAAQEAVTNASDLMEMNLDELNVGDTRAIDIIHQLGNQLTEMHQLLNDQDHVGLSDMLGFELKDTADAWIEMIEALSNKIQKG